MTEIFLPLVVGACVCLVDRIVAMDAVLLAKKIAESNISYMQATPATWRMLLETGWTGVADLRIVSGGETMTRDLAKKLLPRCGELWNLYGPTETAVWATTQRVRQGEGSVPIGIPIADTDLWLLNEEGNPVRDNQAGELYIGGACLARGYLHDPKQTAEKFITHPFSETPGARLYRTGDIGCFQQDGSLLHLGRTDHQVKVRGYRIELGEIESALEALSTVNQAVVTTLTRGLDDTRLIAYLKAHSGSELDRTGLKDELGKSLPDYMIPATFVLVEGFPLTPSGKVDRRALPTPESRSLFQELELVPPSNDLEEKLVSLVSEVLKIKRVGVHDDLFNLGADSLKIAQIVARLRDHLDVELEQRCLFEQSTVAGIAELIEAARKSPPSSVVGAIERVPRDGHLPLSFAQQRVWFLHQLYPDSLAYNFQCTIRMRGALEVTALEEALNTITRRHEIYRTTYELTEDEPTQIIHEHENLKLPVVDFSALTEVGAIQAAEVWYEQAFQERYDPTCLPMARWRLLRFGEEDHVLVHMEHHLVHDGWSFNLFLKELFHLYSAFAKGHSNPLEELPVQFVDFAAWERKHIQSPDAGKQLQYWKKKLEGMPHLLMLRDCKPRPASQSFLGAAPRVELSLSTCLALRQLGRTHRATLFMTMFTGFVVLLHRYSGRLDMPVGTVFANRRHSASESLIGMILNNVVIRASLDGKPTFSQLLKQIRTLVLEASTNQEVPFDRVVEAIDPPRSSAHNPLFQVFFGFHDEPMPESGPEGLEVKVTPVISNGSAKFDLGVIVIPHSAQEVGLQQGGEEDGLTLVWEHSTDLFESSTIERMIEDYHNLLEEMVVHPDQPVSSLEPIISLEENSAIDPEPFVSVEIKPQAITPPRKALEARLMDIWNGTIGGEKIDVHDDFFDLGGHSLLATKIIVRIRDQLGFNLSLRDLFDKGTISAIAEHIESSKEQ